MTASVLKATGAYWSTRSILQILEQNDDTMPMGVTRDYPKYEVRGFMLDVARKPISMETLQSIVKSAFSGRTNFAVHQTAPDPHEELTAPQKRAIWLIPASVWNLTSRKAEITD